jgi:pimeloyl-ACP methyl ester carboxylesterase
MAFLPRHVVHTAPGASPIRWAWLLHGILGSAQNLRTLARRLAESSPEWGFLLADLRNHGESRGAPGPHTVAACADDLLALSDAIGVHPTTAIGHSFGGKVALLWAERAEARGHDIARVWALDVPPGRPDAPLALHSEVVQVVGALRAVPVPLPRREAVVTHLEAAGFSTGLAQWMTTNLRATDAGFVWRFDLDAVEEMLRDYTQVDAWPWLRSPSRRARVDVLRAARSERWSDAERARLDAAPPGVHHHVLADAGHWVHVDNLDGLVTLLRAEGIGE